MTVNIYESPSKEEVASGRLYDKADAEDENNIQTMGPVWLSLCTPNPCTYEGAVRCNPEHRDYMIDLNTWIDSH